MDGGGLFCGDRSLSGRHGFTNIGDGVDGCISAAEERGEGRRASGGQKAGSCGAEGGHDGLIVSGWGGIGYMFLNNWRSLVC